MASLKEMLAAKIASNNVSSTVEQKEVPKVEHPPIVVTAVVKEEPKPVSIVDNLKSQLDAIEDKQGKSLDEILDEPLGKTDSKIMEDALITTADIVPRIRQLNSLSDMEAEKEMSLLKIALMANPEAVALMLPEDVGLLVATLRRIVREEVIATAAKKTTKKAKETKVDAKTLWATDVDDF